MGSYRCRLDELLGETEDHERVDIESECLVARSIQERTDRHHCFLCNGCTLSTCPHKHLGIPTGVVYGDMPREEDLQPLSLTEKLHVPRNVMVQKV